MKIRGSTIDLIRGKVMLARTKDAWTVTLNEGEARISKFPGLYHPLVPGHSEVTM